MLLELNAAQSVSESVTAARQIAAHLKMLAINPELTGYVLRNSALTQEERQALSYAFASVEAVPAPHSIGV